MKKFRFRLAVCIGMIGLLISFSACEPSHLAIQEREVPGECWAAADTLHLTFSNQDTSQVYQLYFPITLTEDYPYSNIYLHAIVRAPSGAENVLPSRFDLASPDGKWETEVSGDEIPFTLNLGEGLRFNQIGDYTFRLYHFMRDEPLCGIRKIGMVLDPVNPN